ASTELLKSIADYNNESISEMKRILWKGSEDWDILLKENAKVSGRLVLTDFTKKKLKAFKK
ncbi:MAG: enoyl-CoA hydratase/isomerase family protein, partial [Flavobacteriales bacterium]|nr:enoyl-CoA hydratase/isomerase family protein [Flavobacteriales bacterium]